MIVGRISGAGRRTSCVTAAAFLLGLAVLSAGQPGGRMTSSPPRSPMAPAAIRLPLTFEANRGQADPRVRFIARGEGGGTLMLTDRDAMLAIDRPSSRTRGAEASHRAVIDMQLIGAGGAPEIAGVEPLPGTANYLIGSDPAQWHTGVPTYGGVEYRDLYPGVRLDYHGSSSRLEYDFVIAPGADPSAISLGFRGTQGTALDGAGNLQLDTAAGRVTEMRPTLYQEVGGTRHGIGGDYALGRDGLVRFRVGPYDRGLPLVIDPVLAYSTYLGGNADDEARGIAVDASGNAFVTGMTQSTDLPDAYGGYQPVRRSPTCDSCYDAFVTKLDSTGGHILYSTYLGGHAATASWVGGIAVDGQGRAVIAGAATSPPPPASPDTTDFPHTFLFGPRGGTDAFVAKLGADGRSLVYSTIFGGGSTGRQTAPATIALGVAVDGGGSAYIAGLSETLDYPTTAGAFRTSRICLDCTNAVIIAAKFDPDRGRPVYSTYINTVGYPLGNSDFTQGGSGVAVDSAGEAYIAGGTQAPDFPTTPGAYQQSDPGTVNADGSLAQPKGFLLKLDRTGSSLLYSTFLGSTTSTTPGEGDRPDSLTGVAVDAIGDAYVTGSSAAKTFPTTRGAILRQRSCPDLGCEDPVAAKLRPAGHGPLDLLYSTYLGGAAGDANVGQGVAVDSAGDMYVGGSSDSADFPSTAHFGPPASARSGFQGFVARIHPGMNGPADLIYSATFGAIDNGSTGQYSEQLGMAVDDTGAYATGTTNINAFYTTPGALQPNRAGGACRPRHPCTSDAFVLKIPSPVVTGISPPTGPPSGGTRVTVTGRAFSDTSEVRFKEPLGTRGGSTSLSGLVTSTPSVTPDLVVTRHPCPDAGGTGASPCFTEEAPTRITVYTPAHPLGPTDVSVVTSWGPSARTPADIFTYVASGGAPPPPQLTDIAPACGPTAGGGPVGLTLSRPALASSVTFDRTTVTGVAASGPTLTVPAPPHRAGTVFVTVAGATGAVQYRYADPCGTFGTDETQPLTRTASALASPGGHEHDSSTPFSNGGFGAKGGAIAPLTPSPPGLAPAPVPVPAPLPSLVGSPHVAPGPQTNPGSSVAAREEAREQAAAEHSHAMVGVHDPVPAPPPLAVAALLGLGGCLLPRRRSPNLRCPRPAPAWGRS